MLFPRGKPAAAESRYPTYGACWVFYSVSIIHMRADVNDACDCTRGAARRHVRESALKVDTGRKIPSCIGESNLRQRRAGPTELHPPPTPQPPSYVIASNFSSEVSVSGRCTKVRGARTGCDGTICCRDVREAASWSPVVGYCGRRN